MSLGLAVAAACALLEPSVPAPSAPAPPAAPSNATWPWLTDECKLTEPYDCVAKGACGFCVSTWTCVPGDEHGPIEGALPCPPVDTTERGNLLCAKCSWANSSDGLHKIEAASHGGPGGKPGGPSLATMRPPQYKYNNSVGPEWDSPCVNGGQRYWGKFPTTCTDSCPKDGVVRWGGNSCDCPEGVNGNECGGCSSDEGCQPSDYCVKPDNERLDQTDDLALSCFVPTQQNVSVPFAAQYVFGFAGMSSDTPPRLRAVLGRSRFEAKLLKAVDFPYSTNIANDFARFLSPISFVGKASRGVDIKYMKCGTDTEDYRLAQHGNFPLPFAKDDECVVWRLAGEQDINQFFHTTPSFRWKDDDKPFPSFYHDGGWMRYDAHAPHACMHTCILMCMACASMRYDARTSTSSREPSRPPPSPLTLTSHHHPHPHLSPPPLTLTSPAPHSDTPGTIWT